jgi:hypothetical protein
MTPLLLGLTLLVIWPLYNLVLVVYATCAHLTAGRAGRRGPPATFTGRP